METNQIVIRFIVEKFQDIQSAILLPYRPYKIQYLNQLKDLKVLHLITLDF